MGPPTWRISKRNSTDNASWGGPNIEKLDPQFLQTMPVGWPNIEAGRKSQLTISVEYKNTH